MSWSNPTPDEASDSYYHYKNKYTNAANDLRACRAQNDNLSGQVSSLNTQMGNISSQKLNFEKRLEGIEEIIKMMEGTSIGWFSVGVPEAISRANRSLNEADSAYHSCMVVTDGPSAASLTQAFETKTVEGEASSSAALQQYKAEKARLEQAIENLKRQLANIGNAIDTINAQIRNNSATIDSLRNVMNSSAYEMDHYKKFMN